HHGAGPASGHGRAGRSLARLAGLCTARLRYRAVLAGGRRPGRGLVLLHDQSGGARGPAPQPVGRLRPAREQILRRLVQRTGGVAHGAVPGPRPVAGRRSRHHRRHRRERQREGRRLGGGRQPALAVGLHLSLRLCHDHRHHGVLNLFRADGSLMASDMASSTFPWLTLSIFVPIVAGLLVLLLGRDDRPGFTRWLALAGSVLGFLVTLPLYTGFNPATADMQFVENTPWIETFAVNYHLGIDGISLWFVLLTAFITVIVVLAGWEVITKRVAQYMGAFLILSGLMVGVFSSLDGMLFYVFFEATLIPMYLIIGVWGGPNRVYAAFKFFLYTLLGSLLTLVAFIYLWHAADGSFDILAWHQLPLGETTQILVFLALFAAFAVK